MERLIPGLTETEKKIYSFLNENVIGQEKTMKELAKVLGLLNSRINYRPPQSPNRPIHSALFMGPSGVGKTFTAETLGMLFGLKGIIKIDCAAQSDQGSVNNIIGASKGYIGYFDPSSTDPMHAYSPPLLYDIYRYENKGEDKKQEAAEVTKLKITVAELTRQIVLYSLELAGSLKSTGRTEKDIRVNIALIRSLNDERNKAIKDIEAAQNEKVPNDFENAVWSGVDGAFNLVKAVGALMRPRDAETRKVRAVVLFDEIEKGSEELRNLLFSILDKGEIQLAHGETVEFRDAIIIMTSNVGSRGIVDIQTGKHRIGFGGPAVSEKEQSIYRHAREEAEKFFKQAFLNRIDWVGAFRPLSRESFVKIFDLQMKNFKDYLAKNFPVNLEISDEVKNFIVDETDRAHEGARLITRKIEHHIKQPLMELEVAGKIAKGDEVKIGLENGEVVFLKTVKKTNIAVL